MGESPIGTNGPRRTERRRISSRVVLKLPDIAGNLISANSALRDLRGISFSSGEEDTERFNFTTLYEETRVMKS